MAPKQPLGTSSTKASVDPVKKTTQSRTVSSSAEEQKTPQTKYDEAQEDEVQALSAIYQDDFHFEVVKGAWKKTTDRTFTLYLQASNDASVHVTLCGTLTATYPTTLPLLSLRNMQLPPDARNTLQDMLESKPRTLLGEVMIYEIASSIVEILDDSAQLAQARQQAADILPSLEEERTVQNAEAALRAEEEARVIEKKRADLESRKAQDLQQLVEHEMALRTAKRNLQKSDAARLQSSAEAVRATTDTTLDMDRPITFDDKGKTKQFTLVDHIILYRQGPLTKVYTAQPVTDDIPTAETAIILKRLILPDVQADQEYKVKKAILDFEAELAKLKNLRHDYIVRFIDFEIQLIDSTWNVNILTDYDSLYSMKELLLAVEVLKPKTARIYTIQILEALNYCHRHGFIHGRVHPGNVVVTRSKTDDGIFVQLTDVSYQSQLYALKDLAQDRPEKHAVGVWLPPELELQPHKTRKTDIYEAGIVFLEMLMGNKITKVFDSPIDLINNEDLTEPMEELLINFFKKDPKRRLDAFHLLPSEFFRKHVAVFETAPENPDIQYHQEAIATSRQPRARRGSQLAVEGSGSRYGVEWDELGRLGKGGYGEVVKARNKVDGRIYAIKKIVTKTSSELSAIVGEVMLLSSLNHAYVVRYYNAWPEEDFEVATNPATDDSATDTNTTEEPYIYMQPTLDSLDFQVESASMDFVSASGPDIQFGNDTESDGEENNLENLGHADGTADDSQDANNDYKPLRVRRATSDSRVVRPVISTLYIQMEFCEKRTLRDLIRKDAFLDPEQGWRYLYQILEGLAHVHSQNIIHRDLKPDNIFIDVAGLPKIGDFGLATSGQQGLAGNIASNASATGDMTRSVGTTLYVAPELSSHGSGNYTGKVDMYSLGIIFFEMCHRLSTLMERDKVIRGLRQASHELPPDFSTPEKSLQGRIILSLIRHVPSDRPSSTDLLESGTIPVAIEDTTVQAIIAGMADSSSPYHQKFLATIFAKSSADQIKDLAWDMTNAASQTKIDFSYTIALQAELKSRLTSIFQRHGAIEKPRQPIFPLSHHYIDSNNAVARYLDPSGCMLQLAYDLTLPHARQIARRPTAAGRTFTIGNVYRHNIAGSDPDVLHEVDFDIVGDEKADLILHEAETIKVVDEIIVDSPWLVQSELCFHLGHGNLLDAILNLCGVSLPQQPVVKRIISRLNIAGWGWQKVRGELRNPNLGLTTTILDSLGRFDFRDTPDNAFARVATLFNNSSIKPSVEAPIKHLRRLLEYLKLLDVRTKILVCPLSAYNEKLYTGGVLFQCLTDKKSRRVIAAGGRYDNLIKEFVHGSRSKNHNKHAVGISISFDNIVNVMKRFYRQPVGSSATHKAHFKDEEETPPAMIRRCDVLITSTQAFALRSTAVKVMTELWHHNISTELTTDYGSADEAREQYRKEGFTWIVVVEHEPTNSGGKPELKVYNIVSHEETEIFAGNLVQYLLAQLRERDRRETAEDRSQSRPAHQNLRRENSGYAEPFVDRDRSGASRHDRTKVLFSQHRSKKSNKFHIVQMADTKATELLSAYANAPIIAVECGEAAMEAMRGLRGAGDAEGWKRVVQAAPLNERQYLTQIQDELKALVATSGSGAGQTGGSGEGSAAAGGTAAGTDGRGGAGGAGPGVAFVYNFRTAACVLFDLV